MIVKSFDKDNNYIVQDVQRDMFEQVALLGIKQTISHYLRFENPLGLVDDLILTLEQKQPELDFLKGFYQLAASVYRYEFANNQLEMIWDGRSHYEKYADEWTEGYLSMIDLLGANRSFNKAVIRGAYLLPYPQTEFIQQTLNRFLLGAFEIKKTSSGYLRKSA